MLKLSPSPDPFFQFKQAQKQGGAHFFHLEALTIPQAPRLIRHAKVKVGNRVLDVACGTGVVSITAAHGGNGYWSRPYSRVAAASAQKCPHRAGRGRISRRRSESLPFPDSTFDVVLSQFGHIFAPRPEVAICEMLRVLKPGGTMAFSTWPPELYVGRSMALSSKYFSPPGMPSPRLWGDPNVVRERLGDR